MAHGKKAYGKGLISKDRSQGILQTFAHFPHNRKKEASANARMLPSCNWLSFQRPYSFASQAFTCFADT